MKKYLLTLALLSASFSFIGQVAAVPCACPNGDLRAPQIQNCNPNEPKPAGHYGKVLNPGECFADCDCAPGQKCSVQPGPMPTAPGHCQ